MSEKLRVDYESGDRFRVSVRGHEFWVDQPVEDGGEDSAASPTELFAASLASCVAFFARRFLERHGLATDGLAIEVSYEVGGSPRRVTTFHIDLQVSGDLSDQQLKALGAVARRCTISNTLEQGLDVQIAIS